MAVQRIEKDMIIADMIEMDDSIIPVLLNIGMHCIGCASSLGETLEDAAYVHGLDPDDLCEMLNEYIGASEE